MKGNGHDQVTLNVQAPNHCAEQNIGEEFVEVHSIKASEQRTYFLRLTRHKPIYAGHSWKTKIYQNFHVSSPLATCRPPKMQ